MDWFVQTSSVPSDIAEDLRATMFRRMSSLVASGLAGVAIALIAAYRHPTMPFVVWACVDGALLGLRLILITAIATRPELKTAPRYLSLFVASSLSWCMQIGAGGFICMTTGDPVLSVYASLMCVGTTGALSARNPGAPRLSIAQMILIVTPFSLGALLSNESSVHPIACLAPFFLWGMISINLQLHGDYVKLLTAQRNNRRLATYDALSGLSNRMRFDEMLEKAVTRAATSSVSVFYLDLDGFKKVNDEHGHSAGDAVLKEVAQRLRQVIPVGVEAARLGGDEFALMQCGSSREQVESLAQAIIREITRPFALPTGSEVAIGVSIGLSTARMPMKQD